MGRIAREKSSLLVINAGLRYNLFSESSLNRTAIITVSIPQISDLRGTPCWWLSIGWLCLWMNLMVFKGWNARDKLMESVCHKCSFISSLRWREIPASPILTAQPHARTFRIHIPNTAQNSATYIGLFTAVPEVWTCKFVQLWDDTYFHQYTKNRTHSLIIDILSRCFTRSGWTGLDTIEATTPGIEGVQMDIWTCLPVLGSRNARQPMPFNVEVPKLLAHYATLITHESWERRSDDSLLSAINASLFMMHVLHETRLNHWRKSTDYLYCRTNNQ
jgi:hypothetical protein